MTSHHSWSTPDLTPFSTGVMTCLRCGAVTNNSVLADLNPCPEPAVTDDTPMEAGPLHVDGSRDERVRADLIERNRRLMRREYQRTYAHMHPLSRPEFICVSCKKHSGRIHADSGKCPLCHDQQPVLEQSGFAPLTEDEAQSEELAKRDPLKDSYWFGFGHGFVVSLALVLVLTVLLLVSYK